MSGRNKSVENIAGFVDSMASVVPYQKAVIFPQGQKNSRHCYSHVTYAQLKGETDALAFQLRSYGIDKGTKVALMVTPSIDFFVLTFSLFKIGSIPIFIDPGIGLKALKTCLREAQPNAFIGIPKAQIARILFGWERGRLDHIVTVGSFGWGGTTLAKIKSGSKASTLKPTIASDKAAILFTSGSTGIPKGALYHHSNFMAQIDLFKKAYQIMPGEVDLCTFPLFALFAPALGMTAVIPTMDFTKPAKVNPGHIFRAIDDFGVHNLFGSPALLNRLSQELQLNPRTFPSIKRIISAGAPVPHKVLAALKPCLNRDADLYTPYGATESLPICSISATEILEQTTDKTKTGSGICVGRPLDQVKIKIIRITDDPIASWSDHYELKPGEIGEIIVSGPQVTTSYYNRPIANKQYKIFDPIEGNTWHRMGDLGYLDQKGRLWFCGRKAHRVRTTQGDMYTIKCESIFNQHAGVKRTALVGVGPQKHEKPVLCVESNGKLAKGQWPKLRADLLTTAKSNPETASIEKVLLHKEFPVDIRHNSKIFREKLKVWAEKELGHGG